MTTGEAVNVASWPSPDWPVWLAAESVTVEQAVALSLGRSPTHQRKSTFEEVKWEPLSDFYDPEKPWPPGSEKYEAAAQGRKIPVARRGVTWEFAAHSLPEGHTRLGEVWAALARGDSRLPLQPGKGQRILLADFVRFARDHDWQLPPRLTSLLDPKTDARTATNKTRKTISDEVRSTWEELGRPKDNTTVWRALVDRVGKPGSLLLRLEGKFLVWKDGSANGAEYSRSNLKDTLGRCRKSA